MIHIEKAGFGYEFKVEGDYLDLLGELLILIDAITMKIPLKNKEDFINSLPELLRDFQTNSKRQIVDISSVEALRKLMEFGGSSNDNQV